MNPTLGLWTAGPVPFSSRSRPNWMVVALIASDTVALLLAVAISLLCKIALHGPVEIEGYLRLLPFLAVFLGVFAALGLYSDVSVNTPEELRRAALASALLFFFLGALTVGIRGGSRMVTGTIVMSVLLAMILVPLFRAVLRRLLAPRQWWGYPAVVFGSGEASRQMVASLLKDPGFGLKPRALVDESGLEPRSYLGVPVMSTEDVAGSLRQANMQAYAVMVLPESSHPKLMRTLEEHGDVFSRVLVLPELLYSCSQFATSKSVGGRWGLELRSRGLDSWQLHLKRLLDLALLAAGSILVLPLCLSIAAVVKITSPGPVFYGQRRIGRAGREFKAWKFRTMRTDADRVIETYLKENPGMRAEWELTRKLKNDPRVTPFGSILRRASLDELPQLWNVFRGEMSLVGPRPIVAAEVPLYGRQFDLYKLMPAGLTGLWQVSGRNDTSYEERVAFDAFYARNWSVWLDLYILSRTIGAVLSKSGAY